MYVDMRSFMYVCKYEMLHVCMSIIILYVYTYIVLYLLGDRHSYIIDWKSSLPKQIFAHIC